MVDASSFWLANPGGGGFYNGVATTSLRFDDNSGHFLSRTPSDTGNRRKFTWSGWFKRANITTGVNQIFLSAGTSSVNSTIFYLDGASDIIRWYHLTSSGSQRGRSYTVPLRDTSAWYHIVFAVDTEVANSSDTYNDSNRVRVYLNGTELRTTDASYGVIAQNSDLLHVNTAVLHQIGKYANLTNYTDGYFAEVNFVDDAQLTPSSFGETKNGVWIPIAPSVTYGATGCRLQFTSTAHDAPASENSADTDNIGADSSGQNNHWTASDSISAEDCAMPDSPENNFCTLNSLVKTGGTQAFSEGNLKIVKSGTAYSFAQSTFSARAGKWYAECLVVSQGGNTMIGIAEQNMESYATGAENDPHNTSGTVWYVHNGGGYVDGSSVGASTFTNTDSYTDNDIIGIAIDLDSGTNTVKFYLNNTLVNTTNFTANFTDHIGWATNLYNGNTLVWNFGQDASFAGEITAGTATDENDIGAFKYAPPSGYLALCTANLPEPTIGPNSDTNANDHFEPVIYEGNGSTKNIPVNFKPDWTWIKNRDTTDSHQVFDSTRLATYALIMDGTTVQGSGNDDTLTAFIATGFSLGDDVVVNTDTENYISWNWKANGGTTSSYTPTGADDAVTMQRNVDAGFSICQYAGSSNKNRTIGHGLQVGGVDTKPDMMIIKSYDYAGGWIVWHKDMTSPTQYYLKLDLADATAPHSTDIWNHTAPTSTLVHLGNDNAVNKTGSNFISYFFASVEGYSKIDTFEGNGVDDGAFVYTGFRPAWLMIKSDDSSSSWLIFDNKREGYNVDNDSLSGEVPAAEATTDMVDLLSNGFKLRDATDPNVAETYVYMAFAEVPFKYANAR